MKSPIVLNIALLTLVATAFYTYVGQLVPQKEVQPPEVTEMAADVSTEEMVEIGQQIFEGKGLCTTCHTLGQSGALRFPDLAGIATRAGERIPGMGPLEYLAQSLYDPNAFVVEGFAPGMPDVSKPPIGLTDSEIRAVLAYLQSLGGEATITMQTPLPYGEGVAAVASAPGEGGEAAAEQAAAATAQQAAETAVTPAGGAAALWETHRCASCHYLDQPGRLRAASLIDVGARLGERDILAAIAAHEQLAEGGEELAATGFDRLTLAQVGELASYLAERTGS